MSPRRLLLATALACTALFGAVVPAGAEDEPPPPPGAVDGLPVGGDDVGVDRATAVTMGTTGASTAAATTRYFGREPYQAIRAAVAAAPRPCSISTDGLTALVMAPIFQESSAATTAASAPAPMTLSRYDEWTGTLSTSTNANANYGLYAFRQPNTPYARAYWHAGIGIWQYDSAGLGAGLNAAQAMDPGTVAADAARRMAARLCAAEGSALQRRYVAWTDWGYPCTSCERAFQDLWRTGFASLRLVDGIERHGGVDERTCTLANSAPFRCWYVHPAFAQGSRWWVDGLPLNDGRPTTPPTPLTKPFYVFSSAGREERHWLREDTAYPLDISAARGLGKNARPRSNQPGSGLAWANTSTLCDRSALRGRCDPVPPPGTQVAFPPVNGSYAPLVADLDGNQIDDVIWYGAGGAPDFIWRGSGPGSFAVAATEVNGDYRPLAGDIDGDGDDDVLWYSPSSTDFVWMSRPGGDLESSALDIGPGAVLLFAQLDVDPAEELLVYGPGAVADARLEWTGTGLTATPLSISGSYRPLVGDYDGNGVDDVFWYGPGSAADGLWLTAVTGEIVASAPAVDGRYTPAVADLDGDAHDDIVWYAAGSSSDYVWFGGAGGRFDGASQPVSGTYAPLVVDLGADGRDDLLWYAAGAAGDHWWRYGADRVRTTQSLRVDGLYVVRTGRFGGDAVAPLWYGPGRAIDAVWYG